MLSSLAASLSLKPLSVVDPQFVNSFLEMLKVLTAFLFGSLVDSVPCLGPLQSNLLYGCEKDMEMADRICCHNTRYAEHWGYFSDPHVDLFSKINQDGTTTFYDSQCGLPLFIAPVGRSLEEWKQESTHHGWPSFRPEELVKENIVIHAGGEMASTCGTHLGHNLPDSTGDRYCIDLVCIAGKPASLLPQTNASLKVIHRTSSHNIGLEEVAEGQDSSNMHGTGLFSKHWIVFSSAGFAVALAALALIVVRNRRRLSHTTAATASNASSTAAGLEESLAAVVAKKQSLPQRARAI